MTDTSKSRALCQSHLSILPVSSPSPFLLNLLKANITPQQSILSYDTTGLSTASIKAEYVAVFPISLDYLERSQYCNIPRYANRFVQPVSHLSIRGYHSSVRAFSQQRVQLEPFRSLFLSNIYIPEDQPKTFSVTKKLHCLGKRR